MSIYTKNGDKGTTNLVHTKNVSKADDRIQLEGTIDELSCHIGVLEIPSVFWRRSRKI